MSSCGSSSRGDGVDVNLLDTSKRQKQPKCYLPPMINRGLNAVCIKWSKVAYVPLASFRRNTFLHCELLRFEFDRVYDIRMNT